MNNYNPLLLKDYYKSTHADQYPTNTTKIVSYYIPRMSRLQNKNHLVHFGLQAYIKQYLINSFNANFFNQPKEKVMTEYRLVMDSTLGKGIVNYDKIERLHDLGYLPIEIKSLLEGTLVPIGVPMFEISNTHPDFAWLVNMLETSLSCTLWHTQLSATVGYWYRQIVDKYYDLTVDNFPKARAIGDFSMRGQESIESAIKSSAGFALSFLNTATVPMLLYTRDYYGADLENDAVAYGLTSTEHSVMCSNFAVDGDEITMLKRLLTEVYPNDSFNVVADSYDYWNFVDNIIPQCKKEILAHNGFTGVRGDSGPVVEIVTKTVYKLWDIFGGTINSKGYKVLNPKVKAVYGDSITPNKLEQIYSELEGNGFACNNVALASGSFAMQCLQNDDIQEFLVVLNPELPKDDTGNFILPKSSGVLTIANHKDSRCETVLPLQPFTRDSYGIAIKSTYCEVDGKPIMIFKDPKTDTGNFKKSQKGCCVVWQNEDGTLRYKDNLLWEDLQDFEDKNLLQLVFCDGKMVKEQTLQKVRQILHKGDF